MKRKVLVTLCLCMIGLAGTVTGCGSKKEETPVVEEEKKEPELKAIGQEDKEAFKVEVKNATGKNIKGIAIKLTDEDAYPENMLEEGDVFADQESRNLYYKALEKNENEDVTEESETTENDGTDDEKVLEQGYDVQLTFEDDSTAELHAFPFGDIEKGDLCYADDVAYLTYTSIESKEQIDTKEAELAVKQAAEQKAAEEAAAQAAAEQKAAEEAAAQAAAAQAAAKKKRNRQQRRPNSRRVLEILQVAITIAIQLHLNPIVIQEIQGILSHQEMMDVWMMDYYIRSIRKGDGDGAYSHPFLG